MTQPDQPTRYLTNPQIRSPLQADTHTRRPPPGQNFSQVRSAYIRIATYGGHEIARYSLPRETATAVVFGELYRFRGKWKFRAVGRGYASGLRGVAMDFGVNV